MTFKFQCKLPPPRHKIQNWMDSTPRRRTELIYANLPMVALKKKNNNESEMKTINLYSHANKLIAIARKFTLAFCMYIYNTWVYSRQGASVRRESKQWTLKWLCAAYFVPSRVHRLSAARRWKGTQANSRTSIYDLYHFWEVCMHVTHAVVFILSEKFCHPACHAMFAASRRIMERDGS